jgi:predicted N-acetyltransferase YhbS
VEFAILEPLQAREDLRQCLALARQRMGPIGLGKVIRTLRLHRYRLLVVARAEGKVVGFKLGFAERPRIFYSWLGAVEAAWEGQGIGRRLMELQHHHLDSGGFTRVRTGTRNRFRRMLILNLLSGFEIVGVKVRANGEAHLQMEKRFTRILDPITEPAPHE